MNNFADISRRKFARNLIVLTSSLLIPNSVYTEQNLENKIEIIVPPDAQVIRIGKRIKYNNGETKYSGYLKDNEVVEIIESEKNKITKVTGLASYYRREKGASQKTATGGLFYDDEYSLAVNERLGWKLPCWAKISSFHKDEKKITIVYAIATNHGPYMKNRKGEFIPHDKRIADLTIQVAKPIGLLKNNTGIKQVTLEYVQDFDYKNPRQLDGSKIEVDWI